MGVVAIFAAIAVMVYNHVNVKPNNSILAKNIEALSQSEDNTAGACCLNGYKNGMEQRMFLRIAKSILEIVGVIHKRGMIHSVVFAIKINA